jgi:NTE family protein
MGRIRAMVPKRDRGIKRVREPTPRYESTDAAAQPGHDPAERYTPKRERVGTALCLSGGGFRATLFHLGALRRLNETGVLAKLDTISSVSGGSIMAAFLATGARWPLSAHEPIPADVWERDIAQPVRRFTARNVRTPAILRRLLAPWDSSAGVRGLIKGYAAALPPGATLASLPERPRFVFCATDLCFGVNFVFERARVGDYRLGYTSPPADWHLARAVAASSCFPPIFNPLPVGIPVDAFKSRRWGSLTAPDVRLSDGGLYDNLGLEPVWKSHRVVLVSDGGAVFGSASDSGLLSRLGRYVDILDHQGHALRKRWLISSFIDGVMDGAYWGIGSSTTSFAGDGAGYSKQLAGDVIAAVRTDLDAFSDAEAAVLENHGYALTAAALRTHLGDLVSAAAPPPSPPHPRWLDEDAVRAALTDSWRRRWLGRP